MDFDKLVEQFTDVINFSQHHYPHYAREFLGQWLNAKSKFIDAFGGNLIYEVDEDIQIELDDDEKHNKVMGFTETLIKGYNLNDLACFVARNEKGFYIDKIVEETEVDGEILKPGRKLLKAFKYFIKDKELLTTIQNAASMIIQDNKINGRLCLSVHPLDFLSSSENKCGWRSCHALNGDYRAGNLSYMLDECTIITYLKSKGPDVQLERFPENIKWNNKKWRCLIYIAKGREMLFAGRGYPFVSVKLLDKVKEALLSSGVIKLDDFFYTSCEKELTKWTNTYIDSFNDERLADRYIVNNSNQLVGLRSIIKDAPYSCHFNDVLDSSYYVPYYSRVHVKGYPNYFIRTGDFTIGARTYCLGCGVNYLPVEGGTMFCCRCKEGMINGR